MKRYIQATVTNLYTEDYDTRLATAQTTSRPDVLYALAFDQDYGVRVAVAHNLATPNDALFTLASDKEYYVRATVAQNPNIDAHILDELFKNSAGDSFIRGEIAGNPKTDPITLNWFVDNGDYIEREIVAQNPGAPDCMLQRLRFDEDEEVVYLAEKTLRERGIST